jgi:hypothetical protein
MAAKREFEKGMVKHHMLPIWLAFLGYPPFQTQHFIDISLLIIMFPNVFSNIYRMLDQILVA